MATEGVKGFTPPPMQTDINVHALIVMDTTGRHRMMTVTRNDNASGNHDLHRQNTAVIERY